MATMNISLPEDLKAFVDTQVAGRYSTSSEFIRELIRRDQERSLLRQPPKPYTYRDVRVPMSAEEDFLEFDLVIDGRDIPVIVPYKTIDTHSETTGIKPECLADGYVEYLQTYQPEFAQAAARRLHMVESISLGGKDVS